MDIGKLNRQVTIQRPDAGQDSIGQPAQTWAPLATVFANVRQLSGIETIRAGAESSTVKASIRIRYRADITTAMRVVQGSTVYQIKAVMPDEGGRQFVDLACEVLA